VRSPDYQLFQHWGVVADLPPEEVDVNRWTSAQNVQFREQNTQRIGGYAQYADPLSGTGPLFAMNVLVEADSLWVYCTANQVWVTDGTNHNNITPAGGLQTVEAGSWTGAILNGIPVFSNGADEPFYWALNAGVPCLTLPGWPANTSCKAIRAFKYHLFALNITENNVYLQDQVWWSASAAPGAIPQEWTPAPDNDAGDMILADTPGAIVDGLALRDTFIIYKQFSCYVLSYVAGQYVYTQRKLFLTTGLQSSNCIAELNGEHWVFTGNDVIRHDGQSFRSVVQDKVKNELVESIDPAKTGMCCVSSRIRDQQFWVAIATSGNVWLNKAYVINTTTEDIGVIDLPGVAYVARGIVTATAAGNSWDAQATTWDQDIRFWDQQSYSPTEDSILLCDTDANKLWNHGIDDAIDGQPMPSFVERQSLPINSNVTRAMVTRLVPRVEGEPGETINIRVGGQAYFGQPVTWSDPQPFVIGQDVGVDVQVEGRLISVRFDALTMRKWKLHSYRLGVVDLGLY
jgi:hypothetical protein